MTTTTFDFNEIVRKKRTKFALQKDPLLHGGASSDNRAFGMFSNSDELDQLNRQLQMSSPTRKYNFDTHRDPLLHGGDKNKLDGYFSSPQKLDELDQLRLQTQREGGKGRVLWDNDDTVRQPEGPFGRQNRLLREEDQFEFGFGGASLPMKHASQQAMLSSPRRDLSESLYHYKDEQHRFGETMHLNTGFTQGDALKNAEFRGLSSTGEPIAKGAKRSTYNMHIKEEARKMNDDKDYRWSGNANYTSASPGRRCHFMANSMGAGIVLADECMNEYHPKLHYDAVNPLSDQQIRHLQTPRFSAITGEAPSFLPSVHLTAHQLSTIEHLCTPRLVVPPKYPPARPQPSSSTFFVSKSQQIIPSRSS